MNKQRRTKTRGDTTPGALSIASMTGALLLTPTENHDDNRAPSPSETSTIVPTITNTPTNSRGWWDAGKFGVDVLASSSPNHNPSMWRPWFRVAKDFSIAKDTTVGFSNYTFLRNEFNGPEEKGSSFLLSVFNIQPKEIAGFRNPIGVSGEMSFRDYPPRRRGETYQVGPTLDLNRTPGASLLTSLAFDTAQCGYLWDVGGIRTDRPSIPDHEEMKCTYRTKEFHPLSLLSSYIPGSSLVSFSCNGYERFLRPENIKNYGEHECSIGIDGTSFVRPTVRLEDNNDTQSFTMGLKTSFDLPPWLGGPRK